MYDPLSADNQPALLDEAWQQLQQIALKELNWGANDGWQQSATLDIQQAFADDARRQQRFSREAAGLYVDFSRHAITPALWSGLLALAKAADVETAAKKMFAGEPINHTEGRKVLHGLLRAGESSEAAVCSADEYQQVQHINDKLAVLVEQVRTGQRCGYRGQSFTDVVNIGIGGSDLGPAMVTEALTPYQAVLKVHFVSNVDPSHLVNTLVNLDPATTLFVIASKTFTTLETLSNATSARAWLQDSAGAGQDISSHFLAVSSSVEKAQKFGINRDSIYPMWDWVGGRYSLWSAIGLPIALAVGWDHFRSMCAGAESMDRHFLQAPLEDNLPVILSLLEVLSVNFLRAQSHAVLPYDQNLSLLPAFLQQLTMESNGKRVDRDGCSLTQASCPVVWGAAGTNGQHSFHQLLHQGTQSIPADFLVPLQSHNPLDDQHVHLVTNAMAQAQALLFGKSEQQAAGELLQQGYSLSEARELAAHKVLSGNRPSLTIAFEKTTPEVLGALIALYEHKVFVSSVIWRVNAFDQWGVELGKQISTSIYQEIQARRATVQPETVFDPSTEALLQRLLKSEMSSQVSGSSGSRALSEKLVC